MIFQQTEKQEFELAIQNKKMAYAFKEFPGDYITPISVVKALEETKNLTLLESGEKEPHIGRYSSIGIDPFLEIKAFDEKIFIYENGKKIEKRGDPFEVLRDYLKKYRLEQLPSRLGFAGGAAGFISYDAIRYLEIIPQHYPNNQEIPDLFFQFFQKVIIFDHLLKKISIVFLQNNHLNSESYQTTISAIDAFYEKISHHSSFQKENREKFDREDKEELAIHLNDEEFMNKVLQAKKYIREGEIYQVVLSRKIVKPVSCSSLTLYRALRMISPSPYMFYFHTPDFCVVGASPEKLVSVKGDKIETIPIAGTRPRGKIDAEVEKEKELMNDPKEEAEHMMLVDLARNDVGKVAISGSVQVKQLKTIQKFSHVMHLVSLVQGNLREDRDALDVLKAAFPAGTLSGAPKIRAMEIIEELETSRRGLYGGAVCMIDSKGNFDSCIAIRMAVIKKGIITLQAGAGIVFDSDPKKEAEETVHKMHLLLEALRVAEGGCL